MSRSKKKYPIWKSPGCGTAFYNRIFRRTNKQLLHSGKDLKQLRELVNDYDIHDWVWYDENNPKLYRK
jgi:hypothetical protein